MIKNWFKPSYWFMSRVDREIADLKAKNADPYYIDQYIVDSAIADSKSKAIAFLDVKLKHKKITQEEYELGIADIELALLPAELAKARLEIKRRHGTIDDVTYEYETANMIADEVEREIRITELDYRYGKKTLTERDKAIATINKQPWVTVVSLETDPNNPGMGSFELDWNSYFIEMLAENGFAAPKEEQSVQLWFNEVAKNIALEAFDGVGDFSDRLNSAEEKAERLANNVRFISKYRKDTGNWEAE